MARSPVYVHIYDLYWTNNYTYNLGVGFYHSGIEVYGKEFGYGGHPFAFSGLFEKIPKDIDELGPNFRYKETILLGYTDFSERDVDEMMHHLSQEWHGNSYHLVTRNCNHFSDHLGRVLCGQEVPAWINRVANMSARLPFLQRCLPREWLTPVALDISMEDFVGGHIEHEHLKLITFCNKIPAHIRRDSDAHLHHNHHPHAS
ncbi:deubiquitinase DESI2-like [Paramacrobiotus metropolitanus]|uniref:deubiquitinase DESI2-like n=1 Tax=Paramacrobiotus metropolitanus TaxID=2943436 RepID=UPI0024460B55|nr:deubiquitinase DESI2-like [Paramacrobiotus metropolitanus]